MRGIIAALALVHGIHVKYDESEGPTKPDFGDSDYTVVFRQDPEWKNPLAWTDDGLDDDTILNMNFEPLDKAYKTFMPPEYRLDDEIVDSLESEQDAAPYVKKARKAAKKARKAAKKEAKEKKKRLARKKKLQEQNKLPKSKPESEPKKQPEDQPE